MTLKDVDVLALTNDITYGISEKTRALGGGERRALVRDALETIKIADLDAADLERLTRGIIPRARNIMVERAQLYVFDRLLTQYMGMIRTSRIPRKISRGTR